MLSVQCELLEAKAVEGHDLNAVAYGQLTGHLVRALNVLGLKREPIDVTPPCINISTHCNRLSLFRMIWSASPSRKTEAP